MACFDACTTHRAAIPKNPLRLPKNRLFRAGLLAIAATDAPLQEKTELRKALQGFRVLAPLASEGASLEEDHRSDPGTVVNGVSLNVEYHCLSHESNPGSADPEEKQGLPL